MEEVRTPYQSLTYLFITFFPKALSQPYLEEYFDPQDEPVAEKPFQYEVKNQQCQSLFLTHFDFKFEIDDLPTNALKELVFYEVVKFKKK